MVDQDMDINNAGEGQRYIGTIIHRIRTGSTEALPLPPSYHTDSIPSRPAASAFSLPLVHHPLLPFSLVPPLPLLRDLATRWEPQHPSSLQTVECRKRVVAGESLPHRACSRGAGSAMQEQAWIDSVESFERRELAGRRDRVPDVADRAGPLEWPDGSPRAWHQCGRLQAVSTPTSPIQWESVKQETFLQEVQDKRGCGGGQGAESAIDSRRGGSNAERASEPISLASNAR